MKREFVSIVVTVLFTLRASEAAAQCIVIAAVCVFVFYGSALLQPARAVFASPLGAFFHLYDVSQAACSQF